MCESNSRRAGLVASVACGDHRKLDTSVGVSGRHDFAVRNVARSSAAPPASIASRAQRFVTIAKRPS